MNQVNNMKIKQIVRNTLIVWFLVVIIIWIKELFLDNLSIEILVGLAVSIGVALFEFYSNRMDNEEKSRTTEIELLKTKMNELGDRIDYNLLSLQNLSSNVDSFNKSLDNIRQEVVDIDINQLEDMNQKLLSIINNKNEKLD